MQGDQNYSTRGQQELGRGEIIWSYGERKNSNTR